MGKSRRKTLQHAVANRQQQVQVSVAGFSGPLPPPNMLERYNEVFPGCAERIVAMTERQSEHRQELEKKKLTSDIAAEKRGSILGFIIVMSAIIGGVYLIRIDKDGYGIAAIITALATLAGVFVYGRHAQQKERDAKLGRLLSSSQTQTRP